LWAVVSAAYSALLTSSYFERINDDDDEIYYYSNYKCIKCAKFISKQGNTSSKNTLADLTLLVRNDHARQKLDTRIKLTNQLFRQLPRTADFQAKYI